MMLRCLLMIALYITCTALKALPHSGYVPIAGGKLYYQCFGKGGSPIVVIHGGPGLDQSYFLPQMKTLGKHHQVVFYDQRGSGKSVFNNLTSKSINTNQFVQDIERIRQTLGFKKIIVLGHSWGGMLAMEYAIQYPHTTKALIIMNGAPATSEGFKAFGDEYNQRMRPLQNKIAKIRHSQAFMDGSTTAYNHLFETLFKKYLYKESDIQKLTVNFSLYTAKNQEKIGSIFNETFKNYDIRQKLHHLNLPTLIIHGVTDPIPLWTAKQTWKSIPNAKLIVIQKSGHFSYVEQPKAVFSAIDQFLSRVPT